MTGKLRTGEIKLITRKANDRRQKTESRRDRGGGSMHCISYLALSVLADRIEVFSIYANHSHRHRIITVLCQEFSPSAQSLHPFLTSSGDTSLFTFPLIIQKSLSLSSSFALHLISPSKFFSLLSISNSLSSLILSIIPISFLLFISVLLSPSVLSMSTLEDMLFCKSNKTARVLHLMDAHLHTHSDQLNAG